MPINEARVVCDPALAVISPKLISPLVTITIAITIARRRRRFLLVLFHQSLMNMSSLANKVSKQIGNYLVAEVAIQEIFLPNWGPTLAKQSEKNYRYWKERQW